MLGGSSAITAFILSRLGVSVAFAGLIGQDLFGHFVEEKLLSGGVNLIGLRRVAHEKTGVTIWHSKLGERAGVTYSGPINMLEVNDLPPALLQSARHFHMGAYFLQTRLHPVAPDLFARAKDLGLTTSVDCNYDPVERWDSNLHAVLRHTDFFFLNEDEALKFTGASTAVEAARELATLAGTVVVKLGADGAAVATREEQFKMAAIPTKVGDTTGAGDSFTAGFLAKFLKGSALRTCLEAGMLAGSRNVQFVGGTAAFEN